MILFRTNNLESIRPPTPTERLAAWAYRYYLTRDSENQRIDMARTRRLKARITAGRRVQR